MTPAIWVLEQEAGTDTLQPVSAPAEDATAPGTLSGRDREVLDFERGWWQEAGPKERAIRERFGFSAARYHQVLNRLIDRPEALVYDPMLVRRLLRIREARRKRRVARRFGQNV